MSVTFEIQTDIPEAVHFVRHHLGKVPEVERRASFWRWSGCREHLVCQLADLFVSHCGTGDLHDRP